MFIPVLVVFMPSSLIVAAFNIAPSTILFPSRNNDTPSLEKSGRRVPCPLNMNKRHDESDGESNPRDKFRRELRNFQSSAFKDEIEVGDMVVCKLPNPNLGIYESVSYELRSIYVQSFDGETQSIIRSPLNALSDPIPNGSTMYVTLFSPNIHKEAVVVSPDEVGLSSVRNELGSAAWLALPGFFWVFVATRFYNVYYERTGGNVLDAFWGR